MDTETKVTFKDSGQAFDEAIESGRLSDDRGSDKYAGEFMYMGTQNGVDMFKHTMTRRYLPQESEREQLTEQMAVKLAAMSDMELIDLVLELTVEIVGLKETIAGYESK